MDLWLPSQYRAERRPTWDGLAALDRREDDGVTAPKPEGYSCIIEPLQLHYDWRMIVRVLGGELEE